MRSHRSEYGFGLIEVLVAAVALSIIAGALTLTFTSSLRSQSASKAAHSQVAYMNNALAVLAIETEWHKSCAASFEQRDSCNIDESLAKLYPLFESSDDDTDGLRFIATGTAVAIHADEKDVLDDNGEAIDHVRIRLVVAPDSDTASRFPQLEELVSETSVSVNNRRITGSLSVQMCAVWPQIDESMAIADCPDKGESFATVPLSVPSGIVSDDPMSCTGYKFSGSSGVGWVGGGVVGSASRDCAPFKCASPAYVSVPKNGTVSGCDHLWGWSPLTPSEKFVTTKVYPLDGVVRFVPRSGLALERGTTVEIPIVDGFGEAEQLISGTYRIEHQIDPHHPVVDVDRLEMWDSHSAPASNIVVIEGGHHSTSAVTFKPKLTGTVKIGIRSENQSLPSWKLEELGVPVVSEYLLHPGHSKNPLCMQLMSVPYARLRMDTTTLEKKEGRNSACAMNGDAELVYDQVEPGLYSAQIADGKLKYFLSVHETPGFLFVNPDGSIEWPTLDPGKSDSYPHIELKTCYKDLREPYVGVPLTNPETGATVTLTECPSEGGTFGAGGDGTA